MPWIGENKNYALLTYKSNCLVNADRYSVAEDLAPIAAGSLVRILCKGFVPYLQRVAGQMLMKES